MSIVYSYRVNCSEYYPIEGLHVEALNPIHGYSQSWEKGVAAGTREIHNLIRGKSQLLIHMHSTILLLVKSSTHIFA